VSELVEFVRARLADDQRIALGAGGLRGHWRYDRLNDGPAGEPGGHTLSEAEPGRDRHEDASPARPAARQPQGLPGGMATMNAPPATTTTYVIQRRERDGYTWHDVGDEYGPNNTEVERLKAWLSELRKAWGHQFHYRAVRIKRKPLDW
jgi:hypothetical protein